MTKRTLWGHIVETDARGRNWWLRELKQEVVARSIEGGTFDSIAAEFGTTENMVRKWWLHLRPEGYGLSRTEEPFAEVLVIDEEPASAGSMVISGRRFTINGITLDAQREIALSDLTALLQAVGSVP